MGIVSMMELKNRNLDRYCYSSVDNSCCILVQIYCLQRLVDALFKGEIDEMVALIASGIDINLTLEVFYM